MKKLKVLHYSLGYPPMRSGGLTGYVKDLLIQQSHDPDVEVFHLFPGTPRFMSKQMKVRRLPKKVLAGVQDFALDRSFPLFFSGGIKNPANYIVPQDIEVFSKWLRSMDFDVAHIHTFAGLPVEFVQALEQCHTRIFYTTHDYFGLSPVPTFYNEEGDYDFAFRNSAEEWAKASADPQGTLKTLLQQLSVYVLLKRLKRLSFMKSLFGNKNRKENVKREDREISSNPPDDKLSFANIMEYYRKMFKMVDTFLFNSKVSEQVFLGNIKELKNKKNVILAVSNNQLHSFNKVIEANHIQRPVKFGFIGNSSNAKGLPLLLSAFKKSSSYQESELHIFGSASDSISPNEHIIPHGRFSRSELSQVFKKIDVLVVPSKWHETFGLVVLEGLSNDTPVITSDYVGAGHLLPKEYRFPADVSNLSELLDDLVSGKVNYRLRPNDFDMSVMNFAKSWETLKKLYFEKYEV